MLICMDPAIKYFLTTTHLSFSLFVIYVQRFGDKDSNPVYIKKKKKNLVLNEYAPTFLQYAAMHKEVHFLLFKSVINTEAYYVINSLMYSCFSARG